MTQSTYIKVYCNGDCRHFSVMIGKFSISWGECPGHQFPLKSRHKKKPVLVFRSGDDWPIKSQVDPKKGLFVIHTIGPQTWVVEVPSKKITMYFEGENLSVEVRHKKAWKTTGPLSITLEP